MTKKGEMDDGPSDKRRKIGGGKTAARGAMGRGRQAFSVVTNQGHPAIGDPGCASDCGDGESLEFTKEDIESLLNEKLKSKRFDLKGKIEQMNEYTRKLKLCIKWFQDRDENHLLEQDKLQNSLETVEKKLFDAELDIRNRVDEFSMATEELKKTIVSLEDKFSKEESHKLDALECHRKEREARVAAEKLQASLSEEVAKAQQEKLTAHDKINTLNDMYMRLQTYNTDLQAYNSQLQTAQAAASESLNKVEKEKLAIVENLGTLRSHKNSLLEQLTLSRASQDEISKQKEVLADEVKRLQHELHQVREDRDRQVQQVQALTAEVENYKFRTGKSFAELDALTIKSNALEETCSSQREQLCILKRQLAATDEKLKMADLSASETIMEFEEQKRVVRDLQDRLTDADRQIAEGEKLRKKLHNTILELKGNIRVFCRVRPLLPDDCDGLETPIISYPTSTEALGRGIDLMQNGQKYPFTFDKVFAHESSQQEVFVEISQLVQSALDGYKVCIFAYGQTGSGKTYTMMGRPEAPEQKGLIPRSLEQIFKTSQSLSAQGWKYKMQASMLEIYNETIRDLLCTSRYSSLEMTRLENAPGNGKQYVIKHDANGNTHVSDLTIVDVCNISQISSLLQQAAQSRSVGKTQMNEQSSRSHFVFTLRISGVNENTEQQVQGVLNLIDLAGSERLSRSGATGDRLKETQAINKSLASLSDVIFSLAKKEDHIPFRNSKLTYLLQPCLGGDSKTLMFVNISPDSLSAGESLCSLRFAARVNACEIGIPRRQTSMKLIDSRLSYG